MSDPLRPKKREGWPGLVLTAVLCLGFLYWWFRPARETWQPHTTAQLVARALGEPGLDQPAERLVIDFDLMETAILQARLGMVPEGLETAARIAHPVVQARTIRQLAQSRMNEDAKNLGDALKMCERISSLELRAKMREEILLEIAMMGFADIVMPEATTPLLRARLARCLAETDGQDTARTLLKEGEESLDSLPAEEAAKILPELAMTRVQLAIVDGPQQAFPLLKRLPQPEQDKLLLELYRVCFGRGDSAGSDGAAVAAQVTTPELRHQIEVESLQSNLPLRPVEEILAELDKTLTEAAPGPDKIHALLKIADVKRRAGTAEESAVPLLEGLKATAEVQDPVTRATLLAEFVDLLQDALLFDESKKALSDARDAAQTVVAPDSRLPLLVTILRSAYKSGEIQTAAVLAQDALDMAAKIKTKPGEIDDLADFLTLLGDWPAALSLLPPEEEKPADPPVPSPDQNSNPDAPAPAPQGGTVAEKTGGLSPRLALLDSIATTAVEEIIGYDPASPPRRGEPLDRIRDRAVADEAAAAAYLPGIPAGFQRARATLAIAKGRLLPPVSAADLMLPGDPTVPLDVLPGQEEETDSGPLPPVLPPDKP